MEQQHLIKKQLIEIQVDKNDRVSDLQEEVSILYREKIIPYIDECCTTLSHPNTTHKIPQIVLDIGVLGGRNMADEFEEKLKPLLYQQLAEKISTYQPTFSIQQPDAIPIPGTTVSKSGTNLQMLTYFIQTGLLPWWAKKHDKQSLKNTFEELVKTSPEQLKNLFFESLKSKHHFKRLTTYFSDASLLEIATFIAPQLFPFIKNYWVDLQHFISKGLLKNIPKNELRFQQWQGLFFIISFNKLEASQKEILIEQHFLHLAININIKYINLIHNLSKHIIQQQKNNYSFKSTLPQIIKHINTILKRSESQTAPTTITSNLQINRQVEQLKIKLQDLYKQEYSTTVQEQIKILGQKIQQLEEEKNPTETTISTFDQSEEIYIANAGLVLLWPFLPRFFQTLGLVKEKGFSDEIDSETPKNENAVTHRERAALLLQYLADGITETSEHLLPLNKILCGIDLLQPIPVDIGLTEQEKEESENILTAVIANNPMWKNLSIQGLQSAYLQREGILSFRNGSWCLQVEKKTHDITLSQLPWGFSVVKLPWMEQILYTEWS